MDPVKAIRLEVAELQVDMAAAWPPVAAMLTATLTAT